MNNCLFCESENTAEAKILPIYFNQKTFTWNKCNHCGLLFLLPALSDNDKEAMYHSGYHDMYYFAYDEGYSTQLKIIEPFNKKTFLDYGCGDAGLLSFLQQNNYTVTGVEYDKELVKKLSLKFKNIQFIEEKDFWKLPDTYDIIHLGDVLEHVSDPINLMKKLTKKLDPEGIFFIEGPLENNLNVGYLFRKGTYALKKAINKESVRVKIPYHITYSNARNQQQLFDKVQLDKILFTIKEAGWPYIDKAGLIKSPRLFLQYLVARASIFISAVIPGWGNRFVYTGKPKQHHHKEIGTADTPLPGQL